MTSIGTEWGEGAEPKTGISRRRFIVAGAAAATLPAVLQLLLEACSSSTSSPKGVQNLIIAMDQADLRTLDPNSAFEFASPPIGHAVYEPLVTFAGSDLTKPAPSLAKSWTVSSDGLTYTFAMDPAAKFADDSPVTADDVVFNLERFLNLKGVGSFILDGVIKIAAVGSDQVQITLQSRNPDLLNIMTSPGLGIGKAATIKANGGTDAADASTSDTARAWLDQHSVGSGPYVLNSWVRGSQITMTRNPKYWKSPGAPTQQLTYKFVTDPSIQRDLLKRGDAHVALNLTADLAGGLKGTPNVGILTVPSLALAYLALNTVINPALRDPNAWDAIRYAIDYDGMKTIYGAGGTPIAGPIPFGMGGALPQSEYIKQDLTKAKSALVAAGRPNGFSFKLSYTSDALLLNYPAAIIAQKIKSDLAGVGITANLNPTLATDFYTSFRAGHTEVALAPFGADYAGWTDFLQVFGPTGFIGKTRLGWTANSNPKTNQLAQLITQAQSTVDQQQQYAIVQQAGRLMLKSCPYGWLFQPTFQVGYRTDVFSDFVGNAVWYFDLPTSKVT
jgi:peptide/nickel transport system substrate-binding protein